MQFGKRGGWEILQQAVKIFNSQSQSKEMQVKYEILTMHTSIICMIHAIYNHLNCYWKAKRILKVTMTPPGSAAVHF